MAEVHRLPDVDQSERQASEWIARLHADDVSDDDRAHFESWRASHQLHARIYDELLSTWRAFNAAGPLVRAVSFGQSMNEATTMPASRRHWMIAAAATVVMAMAASLWYRVHFAPETVFQTAIGEHASVSLPDGSTLELNTNSLVRVDYSLHSRVVQLERGQAYFQVAHDKQRPFWVVVDGSWVRAVGTAFDVQRKITGALVTVSEGTVEVGLGDAPLDRALPKQRLDRATASYVTAGQLGNLQDKSIEVRTLSADDLSRMVAWRGGMIYFENQSMREVVAEISRYTTLQLIVDDDSLEDLRLGGMFEASPRGAEAFLAMLQDGFGLRIRRDPKRVYIESGMGDRSRRLVGKGSTHLPPALATSELRQRN